MVHAAAVAGNLVNRDYATTNVSDSNRATDNTMQDIWPVPLNSERRQYMDGWCVCVCVRVCVCMHATGTQMYLHAPGVCGG